MAASAKFLTGGRPSMLQDVMKGRRTEIDYLNGYVSAAGQAARRPDAGQRRGGGGGAPRTASARSSPTRRTSSRSWPHCPDGPQASRRMRGGAGLARPTRRGEACGRTRGAPSRAGRPGGRAWPRRRSARRAGPRPAARSRPAPSGSIIAGWPVRLNHTVNGEKVKTRRQYSSTSSIIMSIQPSLTGSVAEPGREQHVVARVERRHLPAEPVRGLRRAHVVGGA